MRGCKKCGGEEFISHPNQYDVFMVGEDDDELDYVGSELINEKLKLYCRDCGTYLKVKVKRVDYVIRAE